MNKKIFSALAIAGALSFCLAAQEQQKTPPESVNHTLTVEEAVNLAIQNNMSIKQSKMDLDLLEKKNKYSWNSISPSLSVGGGLSDSLPHKKLNNESKQSEETENEISYSVNASATIHFTPSLFTTMNAARIAYENGEISYEKAIRTVEKSVRQSFYNLLNMKETIESNQTSLDAAKRTYESNLAKYNSGRLDQLSLLTSQYNYERLIPTVDSAKNSYQNNMDSLKQVLGINLTDTITLNGSLDDILNVQLDEELLRQDLDELPDIKAVQQNIKSTENNLQAARFSAYGPSVSLSYSYGGGGQFYPEKDKKDYSTQSSTIDLKVSIPLDGYLPWSSGALSIESQKTNLESLKLQLDNAKTTAAISIRNSYNTIQYAQTQLKIYESNLELMQKTYDMTLIAYNNGSKDLDSLQTAQDNLTNARYSLQNQKYTIINAVLGLEETLGIPFGTLSKNK